MTRTSDGLSLPKSARQDRDRPSLLLYCIEAATQALHALNERIGATDADFEPTRKEILDDYTPAERRQIAREDQEHQAREERRARMWIEW